MRHLLWLLLTSAAFAQGPTLPFGSVPQSALTWGTIDMWTPMNTSTPGTQLTTGIMAAGTIGGGAYNQYTLPTGTQGAGGNVIAQFVATATEFTTGSDTNGYYPYGCSFYDNGTTHASTPVDCGIYTNSAGAPATLLCHIGTTNLSISGFNLYNMDLTSASCPTLAASTNYWVSWIYGFASGVNVSNNTGACATAGQPTVVSVKSAAQGSALLPASFGAATGNTNCYVTWAQLAGNTGFQVWQFTGAQTADFSVAATQGGPGGSLTVDGVSYLNGSVSPNYSVALLNVANISVIGTTGAITTKTGGALTKVIVDGFETITYPTSSGGLADRVSVYDGSGGYAVIQVSIDNNTGTCPGQLLGLEIETQANGSTIHSPGCISLTSATRYQYSMLWDETNGAGAYATYSSGATVTGTQGQRCALTGTGFTGYIELSGSNTLSGSLATFLPNSGLLGAAPTSATLGSDSATCSGTAAFTAAALSGLASLAVFNPTTNIQIAGSPIYMVANQGRTLGTILYGNNETATGGAGTSYQDNIMLQVQCIANWPNHPHVSAGGSCP